MSKTLADALMSHAATGRAYYAGRDTYEQACRCGSRSIGNNEIEAGEAHAEHQAQALAEAGYGYLHDAWAAGVATALNHAIENDDGMTLRLEHLDGRPWANPYPAPKVSES